MKTILLKSFIESGKFDTITIGSTKEEVINRLGKKFSLTDCGETQIISYGWYEFFYWTDTGKIFGIQNDHLQADCVNHSEMINFKSRKWTLGKWFLKEGQNITFKDIKIVLEFENIPFKIKVPFIGCAENIIECLNSGVTFDFCREYRLIKLSSKGQFKGWSEVKVDKEDDFVLNGIRIFDINRP